MKKRAKTIDGFTPRKQRDTRARLDEIDGNVKQLSEMDQITDQRRMDFSKRKKRTAKPELVVSDDLDNEISKSLMELPGYDNLDGGDFIDNNNAIDEKAKKKALKKAKKAKKANKPKSKKKKVTIAIISVVILAILAGAWYLWAVLNKPFDDGNPLGFFWQEKLAEDENGRSNILIFGTAPDDYDGPLLADTILVLSVNQNDKSAYMVSLPRDFWVQHDCPDPLLNTTAGKLNETYRCIYDTNKDNEEEASDAFRAKVGEILGMDVQYYAHMGWEAVTKIIDDIDGIDVTIDSSDPRGIYDYNTGIKIANGEITHLDGELALALARARGEGGGYGLAGNFDREKNQQLIIKAVQQKALSGGLLSNPSTVLSLIGTLGNNLRTNFKTSEINVLTDLGKEIKTDNIISLPLLDPENGIELVKTGTVGAASVVVPTAGLFDYSEIHAYIKAKMSSDPIVREAATIDILNGSSLPGLAQKKADELKAKNFIIGTISNAPDGIYNTVEIYQLDKTKPETLSALEQFYNVKAKDVVPAAIASAADFVIVFGAETNTSSN